MGLSVGIVGLPNVGKSTLFNALTKTAAAQAANYPFCTIEPNTGDVAGDEVVQVYLRDEISSVTRPVKELAGFQRVTLQPGESRAVSIPIEPRSLMMWNREMERVIEPGDFTIMVGPNSQDLQDVTLTVVP